MTNMLTIGYDNVDLDKDLVRLGGLFIERSNMWGFTIFSENPRRDLDINDPEHEKLWQYLKYIEINSADALLLLKYLEKRADEFKDKIAQQAMEARQK